MSDVSLLNPIILTFVTLYQHPKPLLLHSIRSTFNQRIYKEDIDGGKVSTYLCSALASIRKDVSSPSYAVEWGFRWIGFPSRKEKIGIRDKLDSLKVDRRRRLKHVFPLVYDRTNLRAALAELFLLGKLRVVSKESQWKKKITVGPEQISSLSKRIKANKKRSPQIKRFVSNPSLHDAAAMEGKELTYPWAGQRNYEFDPLDLIALRCLTQIFSYMLLPIYAKA
uniref:Uncharacterized protein n=1 Tax=Picea glauca TaxID=3330 RepID=A0A124GMW1_PICGL|nr:hypothetical protein ABT39_MTgene6396 [Picea glauca]QHR86271.1 hypothetical protein Q903MT_gene270 [Picea sitchensis]